MASSSSSTSVMASSSDVKACSYDVFLSFSGKDTRYTFTDHLYDKLTGAGIHTFRDEEEINKGEELKPELTKAIEESRASIVVLSKSYATSTWCLDELQLILEQRRFGNYFVLPVFYQVEPTDVRKHKGSFDIQVKPSSKWTEHNVSRWKAALMEVADLSGEVVSGSEVSILKKIVDTLYKNLGHNEIGLPPNITGMSVHETEISLWYEQSNSEIFVIYGMGGSGKTTLAKYIYNLYQKSFKYVSFIENIGSTCQGADGLHKLQQQFLNNILGGKNKKIPGPEDPGIIANALEMKRSLIVLDDIVDHKQVVDFLGTRPINTQSKIIITTRENPKTWFKSPRRGCQTYEIKLLNPNESSELLCRHAFGSKFPLARYKEHVRYAIHYCEGNPLALEVLGSSLFNCDVEIWASHLRSLTTDVHSAIQDIVKKSYESLPTNILKELFLHIACFFKGTDMDYVVKILEPDYNAISGIKILMERCLVSVSSEKSIIMHRLVQEMGKKIVRDKSKFPEKRSRVWLSIDSHKILKKGKGSKMVEGLALDMHMLEGNLVSKLLELTTNAQSSELKTNALQNMESLKLLQLNYVKLNGSYENFSEDLRWLCWFGFHLKNIPSDLYMGNLVAIDMSYSNLEVFKPPVVLQSLQILNLKDSYNLTEICNITYIPHLETLVLWNCRSLVNVCNNTLGELTSLTLLNMTGCHNTLGDLTEPTFSFPFSLHRLFLKDCHLDSTDSFPLDFSIQQDLQYLNLANSLFESLPCYSHLKNLRVLDLSHCPRLKLLEGLPNTIAELYIYSCELLERITFQLPRFTLQEFGYRGCIHLYEVQGFMKLVPIAKLDKTDLGHMTWLKEYQEHEVCLVGDDELTVGRSRKIQMLYELGIISTTLPNIKDPNMTSEYISESSSLSFEVPLCPENKKLIGINVTLKYAISGDDWAWFCKVSTSNGVNLMYNPRVFGKPEFGELCIWLSYWPIGDKLGVGDTLNVSIVVISGLEVHECGVSLVYSDQETPEDLMGLEYFIEKDLSRFKLITGAYYLCRRDFFEFVEVDRSTPDWFRILVGDTIDYTEVRGWRMTGRPEHINPSFTELKTVRCIIHGPQLEDIYKIAEMSKSSIVDVPFVSSLVKGEIVEETMEEIYDKQYKPRDEIDQSPFPDYTDPYSRSRILNSGEGGNSSLSTTKKPCQVFTLAEMKSATRDFDDGLVIGEDGFGRVYRGQLSKSGLLVAIKRHNNLSNPGKHGFRTEINMLRKFHHHHLVSLIGYCDDDGERIIVYEYMMKGTVNHHIYKAHFSLSWVSRLKIAIGAARGLDYLHAGPGSGYGVIHRNVNSSNILLNEDWEAKISGFGLSMIRPTNQSTFDGDGVKGTFSYLDPEYLLTEKLTWKTDVYAFGVVLFELLSGRLPIGNERGDASLVLWAKIYLKERKLYQIVDPNMTGTISTKCLRGFIQVADRCLHKDSSKRPTMRKIVTSLEALLKLQEKSNSSTGPSGILGFPKKILEYFVPATKPNSDESGTSSRKSFDNTKNEQ